MKKLSLIVILFLAVLALERCKKDTVNATATSTNTLFALINDTTWSATNIAASMAYNSSDQTKTFTCTGSDSDKQIVMTIKLSNAMNTAGFPLSTFNADQAGTVTFSFSRLGKDSLGNPVFVQQGTVNAGSGSFTVSSIDSVKKTLSGIFSFSTLKNEYDGQGKIISTSRNLIQSGAFNGLPYTFTSN